MMQSSRKQQGFTLIELLVSLTILSVIIVIILSGFRVGVSAWEKGEKDIESRQQYRIVLDLIQSQLASVCTRKTREGKLENYYFRGDANSLDFVSEKALIPSRTGGRVAVHYQINPGQGGERFEIDENDPYLPEKVDHTEKRSSDVDDALLKGIQNMEFAYLADTQDPIELKWEASWDSNVTGKFPRAVKILLTPDDKIGQVSAIVRIAY